MEKLTILELIDFIRKNWKYIHTLKESEVEHFFLQRSPLELYRFVHQIQFEKQINGDVEFELSTNENTYNPSQSKILINFEGESDFLTKIDTLKSMVLEKKLLINCYPRIKVSLNGLSVGSAGFTF